MFGNLFGNNIFVNGSITVNGKQCEQSTANEKSTTKDLTDLLTADLTELHNTSVVDVQIDICPSSENKLTLSAAEHIIDQIKVSFSNGVLKICTDNASYVTSIPVRLVLSAKTLRAITHTGVGDIKGKVVSPSLNIRSSATGNIRLAGEVDDLTLNHSGVGDAKCAELLAKKANVHFSGVGDVKIYAKESILAKGTGVGDIHVYGGAAIANMQHNGVGKVKIHG